MLHINIIASFICVSLRPYNSKTCRTQLEKCESESSAVITILCWRISVTHYLWRGAEFTAVISPAPASECQSYQPYLLLVSVLVWSIHDAGWGQERKWCQCEARVSWVMLGTLSTCHRTRDTWHNPPGVGWRWIVRPGHKQVEGTQSCIIMSQVSKKCHKSPVTNSPAAGEKLVEVVAVLVPG